MSVVDEGPPRVDRLLLHRVHPEEAFLRGAVATGPSSFEAVALLPAAHPHYRGHTGPSRDRDPLLLLECARQAETYAAHAFYGVDTDARFVLRTWSATFDPAAPAGAEVRLTGTTSGARRVGDRLRGMTYDLELRAGDDRLGAVRMDVDHPSAAAYRMLRRRKHPGGLPSSDDLAPTPGHPVDPARVGRLRATDTLLQDVATTDGTVTAVLRVPVENPSLFDHAQDHVPAMVLMEAARQVAALATAAWGGPAADRTVLTALTATFVDYAELGPPLVLVADRPPGDDPVRITFTQAGAVVATARITMTAPLSPRGRRTCPAPRS
ncbi:AfsA-related hotdog domain-containing protein [Micromonospora mangrovi]|uniref:AfsA-related hotdog domain-containing protein n=2 Tax=Micromonospora TaxID=1873 RepID=A0AAU8HC89_9ACTN